MNFLELCNAFALRTSLPTATSVSGSSTLRQVGALLQEVLDHLTTNYDFDELVEDATFSTVNSDFQGLLSAIAPLGFERLRAGTFFNRSLRLEVPGALTGREWQAQKAMAATGPISWFRIRNQALYMEPKPSAGQLCAFEYYSNFAVVASGGARKQYPSVDTDTFLLPDKLLLAGIRWRWKAEKGFDYAEEFRAFQDLANSLAGVSKAARPLSLEGQNAQATPGIVVPVGNWITP